VNVIISLLSLVKFSALLYLKEKSMKYSTAKIIKLNFDTDNKIFFLNAQLLSCKKT